MKDAVPPLAEGRGVPARRQLKTYRVVAQRSDDWWAVHVPEMQGVHTQARRPERIGAEAREAIALMLDVEPESVMVRVELCV